MLRPDGGATRALGPPQFKRSPSPVKEQLIDRAWAEINGSNVASSSVLSAAPGFLDMAMSVLQQMAKVRTSFVSLLQERQLAQLTTPSWASGCSGACIPWAAASMPPSWWSG